MECFNISFKGVSDEIATKETEKQKQTIKTNSTNVLTDGKNCLIYACGQQCGFNMRFFCPSAEETCQFHPHYSINMQISTFPSPSPPLPPC